MIVRVAVFVVVFADAEIVTDVEVATFLVCTVNVADVDPSATVTLPGTVAREVSELDRETTPPPVGAGAARVTVAVEVEPPTTLEGESVTAETAIGGGLIVSVAVFDTLA